ncbi:MAG: tetratricopeptide repeat protein [Bacteroidales bacterium]|nr:tetratricopeptide repeat protein [Bacteroidales bacterium]
MGKRIEKQTKIQSSSKSGKITWLTLTGLLMITIIVFSSSLKNEILYGWDDGVYIEDNHVQNLSFKNIGHYFSNYYLGMYQPLAVLSFGINYALSGDSTTSYHFINLLLHLLNVFLVFKLIKSISNKDLTAFLVALLFAIHPMHVESASWIATRSNLLYSAFFLLALISYRKYLENPESKTQLLLTYLWFLLSLFSKSMAVTLPLILLLFDYLIDKKIIWKKIIEKIPFFLLSLIFGLIAIKAASTSGHIENLQLEYSFIDRIFLVSYALVFYIFKLFFPFHLSAIYTYPDKINGMLPWEYYASLVVVILLVVWMARMKNNRRIFIFGTLFFVSCLSVVLPVVWSRIFITADRYTYIAYIGIFFIIAKLITMLFENKSMKARKWRPFVSGLLVIYLLFFTVKSYQRNHYWKDTDTLLTHVIQHGKTKEDVAAGYFYRGSLEDSRQNFRKAFEDYSSALQYNPEYTLAYNNRGIIKGRMQDFEGALQDFKEAIANKPDYAEAYYNSGIAQYQLQHLEAACRDWQQALGLGFGQAAQPLKQYCSFRN